MWENGQALVSQSASIVEAERERAVIFQDTVLDSERKLSKCVPLKTTCTGGTLEKKVLHQRPTSIFGIAFFYFRDAFN